MATVTEPQQRSDPHHLDDWLMADLIEQALTCDASFQVARRDFEMTPYGRRNERGDASI